MQNFNQFENIYKDYSKLVYNLSLNYLQNIEDAQEATQDVFVKVYKKIEGFNKKSSLKTWIYRITINHCLDVIKSKNRKYRVLYSKQHEANDTVEFNHPGVQLESKERMEEIFKEVNKLPDNQRSALILKTVEGMSQKEISAVLDMNEKAVESLLSRARATLKKTI